MRNVHQSPPGITLLFKYSILLLVIPCSRTCAHCLVPPSPPEAAPSLVTTLEELLFAVGGFIEIAYLLLLKLRIREITRSGVILKII
jgi:hypothetical protein